eukprot:1526236-Pleurochrysis_carterae.AAC.2
MMCTRCRALQDKAAHSSWLLIGSSETCQAWQSFRAAASSPHPIYAQWLCRALMRGRRAAPGRCICVVGRSRTFRQDFSRRSVVAC